MIDFCAIDFETATHEKNSACELGITLVEQGQIVQTKTWLIKPPGFPYFHPRNIEVHGIEPRDVADSPTFDEIWDEVYSLLYGNLILAHNASFDAGVLRGTLEHYGLFPPKLNYLCSIQVAKRSWKGLKSYSLKNLALAHQLEFKHHRAGEDAEVCAKLALLGFERLIITSTDEIMPLFQKQIKKL